MYNGGRAVTVSEPHSLTSRKMCSNLLILDLLQASLISGCRFKSSAGLCLDMASVFTGYPAGEREIHGKGAAVTTINVVTIISPMAILSW